MSKTLDLIKRRLRPLGAELLTSSQLRGMRRIYAQTMRRLTGTPRTLTYYHRADDPYCQLMVQALPEIAERFAVEIRVRVVARLPDELVPEPEKLSAYARMDAKRLAELYEYRFPDTPAETDPALADHAAHLLAHIEYRTGFFPIAEKIGMAVLSNDRAALDQAAEEAGLSGDVSVDDILRRNETRLADDGHYLSGMVHYGGEWFWGLDRLDQLELRLVHEGAGIEAGERPRFTLTWKGVIDRVYHVSAKQLPPLEVFFSLRSPYSYLVLNRVAEFARENEIELILRPVLPMVMRGFSIPRAKRWYILHDTKREADKLNLPFGRIADPLDGSIERYLAIMPYARERNREARYFASVMKGSFADGLDGALDADLARMVRRAGLDWSRAKDYLNNEDWRTEVQQNRADLNAMGLWGVPCFRFGETICWGQDRLWVIAKELEAKSQTT